MSEKVKWRSLKDGQKKQLDKLIKEKTSWFNSLKKDDWVFSGLCLRCSADEAKKYFKNKIEELKKRRKELND